MNFAELITELADRGFEDLPATRRERYINQAYQELCEFRRWPFLEATVTGAAPLTITDLRLIQSVLNGTTLLVHQGRRKLLESRRDLSTAGTPVYFYVEGGNVVKTWPTGGTLTVRYWKVPTDLSASTDTPIVPTRFHGLIVDGAVRRAFFDKRDPEQAEAVDAERQKGLALMMAMLGVYDDEPEQDE